MTDDTPLWRRWWNHRGQLPPDGGPTPLARGHDTRLTRWGHWMCKRATGREALGMLDAEAEGLARLHEHDIAVPPGHERFEDALFMGFIGSGSPQPTALASLVAALHRTTGPHYGRETPAWLGAVPLPRGIAHDARTAVVERRVLPLASRVSASLGPRRHARLREVVDGIEVVAEGPVLVHGDLWSGNVVHGPGGPVLIDPSTQWAERAYDLAMIDLFGGFPRAFHQAYDALLPVPGAVRRILPLYRLVFLLVHVEMFGVGYLPEVDRALDALGRGEGS